MVRKSTVPHSSPSLAEIQQAQGQWLIRWTKDRRGGKWGGRSSCCHDIFNPLTDHWLGEFSVEALHTFLLLLQSMSVVLAEDKCVMRDISMVITRGDRMFDSIFKKGITAHLLRQNLSHLWGGGVTYPIHTTSAKCVRPLFLFPFSSLPALVTLSWSSPCCELSGRAEGLHTLCMANSSRRERRWDAALM